MLRPDTLAEHLRVNQEPAQVYFSGTPICDRVSVFGELRSTQGPCSNGGVYGMGSQQKPLLCMTYKPVSGFGTRSWKGCLPCPSFLPPGCRIKLLLNGVSGVVSNVGLLVCKISANALGPYYSSLDPSPFSNHPCQPSTLSVRTQ